MSSNDIHEEHSHHEEEHSHHEEEQSHHEQEHSHHEEEQEHHEEEHFDETPEEELARIRKEIESLEDAGIELRLQLQSETVAQRKELAVVQEDEDRLREHLAALNSVDKKKLPEAEERVAKVEEEASRSNLAHLWAEEVALNNPDKMDLSDIKVDDLPGRAKAAEKTFSSIRTKAASILAKQEKHINDNTDAREKKKHDFKKKFDEEMEGIASSRNLVKQVEREGHFHSHRGTNQRDRPLVSTQMKEESRQRRINNAETRTNGELEARRSEVEEVEAQCVVLERRLEEMKRISETRHQQLEQQLQQAEEDGRDAREMKEKFVEENQELMALKTDINGVIHYVRAKNREYETV